MFQLNILMERILQNRNEKYQTSVTKKAPFDEIPEGQIKVRSLTLAFPCRNYKQSHCVAHGQKKTRGEITLKDEINLRGGQRGGRRSH